MPSRDRDWEQRLVLDDRGLGDLDRYGRIRPRHAVSCGRVERTYSVDAPPPDRGIDL
jgi:hypothetical protein